MAENTEENETKPRRAAVPNFRYGAAIQIGDLEAIIVTPEMDQLRDAWNRLTGGQLELNEARVREVRILPRD